MNYKMMASNILRTIHYRQAQGWKGCKYVFCSMAHVAPNPACCNTGTRALLLSRLAIHYYKQINLASMII